MVEIELARTNQFDHYQNLNLESTMQDLFMNQNAKSFRSEMTRFSGTRSGITLIEVLTSVAVATIGVLGVLILIPLGSRFTETGFDRQRSRQLANNSLSRFEAFGFLNHERWVFKANAGAAGLSDGFARISLATSQILPGVDQDWSVPPGSPRIAGPGLTGYCFDPVFVAAPNISDRTGAIEPESNTQYGDGGSVRFFPYSTSGSAEVNALRIPRLSLTPSKNLNDARPMDYSLAEDLAAGDNFLALQANADETQPPEQVMVEHSDGTTSYKLKRDSTWNMSTLGLLFPNAPSVASAPTGSFRLISLVIKNRSKFTGTYDRVFQVRNALNSTSLNISGGFGEVRLGAVDGLGTFQLSRGDWLIFFPYNRSSQSVDWSNAAFFQIRTADNDLAQYSVTGSRYSAGGSGFETIAIHVPGMVDYREKTVQLNVVD